MVSGDPLEHGRVYMDRVPKPEGHVTFTYVYPSTRTLLFQRLSLRTARLVMYENEHRLYDENDPNFSRRRPRPSTHRSCRFGSSASLAAWQAGTRARCSASLTSPTSEYPFPQLNY